MVRIVRDETGRYARECLALARTLEEGFNEGGLEAMAEDLPTQLSFVAVEDETVVGFATVGEHGPRVAELSWLAVRKDRQGQGIGTRLLDEVSADRAAAGFELLTVKTLADTVEDENYARTRHFYEKQSFRHVDTIDPYPGWDPGNPCAIYVRPLFEADETRK